MLGTAGMMGSPGVVFEYGSLFKVNQQSQAARI